MNSPLSIIISESIDKNPISIINEYCLKTNSKIIYEFRSEDNQFLCLVFYNNQIIGKGKGTKKQVAKTSAAQNALKHLISGSKEDKSNNQKDTKFKALSKKGNFKLSFNDPNFVYQYYINETLIAEGMSITDQQAKQKCIKKALNSLKTEKKSEALKPLNVPFKDIRVKAKNLNTDLNVLNYLESKIKALELLPEDQVEIKRIDQELILLSQYLDLTLVPVGSHSLGLIRRTKLNLDYYLIVENVDKDSISSIFESLEKARLVYLESKAHEVELKCFGLSLTPSLVECEPGLPIIKLERERFLCFIYFYESLAHPSPQHYLSIKGEQLTECKTKIMILLRQWRFISKIDLPVELLDIIVQEFVINECSLYLGFRIILEVISGGIFLNGACYAVKTSSFNYFLSNFTDENRYKAMSVAQKSLISLSSGEIHLILD